jgi:hypothetical protein
MGLLLALILPLIPIILLLVLAGVLADLILRDWMLPHFALDNATAGEAWARCGRASRPRRDSFFVYALLRVILPSIAMIGLFMVLLLPGLDAGRQRVAAVEFGFTRPSQTRRRSRGCRHSSPGLLRRGCIRLRVAGQHLPWRTCEHGDTGVCADLLRRPLPGAGRHTLPSRLCPPIEAGHRGHSLVTHWELRRERQCLSSRYGASGLSGAIVSLKNRGHRRTGTCGDNVYPGDRSVLMRKVSGNSGFVRLRFVTCAAYACAQTAPAKPSAPQEKQQRHLVLPPVPNRCCPDAFAGWVAAEPSESGDRSRAGRPGQCSGPEGIRVQRRRAGQLQARGRDAEPARAALRRRERGLRRLHATTGRMAGPKEASAPAPRRTTTAFSSGWATRWWMRTFSRIGPMSAGELREIAAPVAGCRRGTGDGAAHPGNLPKESLDPQTTHYAVGPAGYAGAGGVLPPALVASIGRRSRDGNYSLTSQVRPRSPSSTTPRRRSPQAQETRFAPI